MNDLFPASIPEYLPRFAQVVASQMPLEFETYARAVGRYQQVTTFPAGRDRFASIIQDITERKRVDAELALAAQERAALAERNRLARELHDSVSQALYGVSLGINTALMMLDVNRARVREALEYSLTLIQAGLAEMRALIFELRPESLEIEGLVAALTKRAAAVAARYETRVELSLCDEPDLPLAAKEALYRIAQEALQNAIKHARPSQVEVGLTRQPDGYWLEVCDNGVGFDPLAEYPGHLGLRSMRERATNVGGTLTIESAAGCGTQVRAFVPRLPMPDPTSV